MAQPPLFNPQVGANISGQQNPNLQQMLSQKVPMATGNVTMQNYPAAIQQVPTNEKTIIDEFEETFQSCLAPLIPGHDNNGSTTISPDKLRSSIDHSIQQFTETARRVESYFLRKHATVAQQQPELILQEEIEELKEEITRRDTAIRTHGNKIKTWQETIRNIKLTVNDRNVPGTPPVPQPVGVVHQDMMQMGAQRR